MSVLSPSKLDGRLKNLSIGKQSFIGRVEMQLHASITIGDRVCINDGVRIFSASHDVRGPEWTQVSGPIVIKDYAWIASGAILLPGVTIGRGAVVGAGSVVASDLPDGAVAVGNPAGIRESIRSAALRYSPESFLPFRRAWLGAGPVLEEEFQAIEVNEKS